MAISGCCGGDFATRDSLIDILQELRNEDQDQAVEEADRGVSGRGLAIFR